MPALFLIKCICDKIIYTLNYDGDEVYVVDEIFIRRFYKITNESIVLHRLNNKPAIHNRVYNNRCEYFVNGKLHRESGPAKYKYRQYSCKEYYLNGEKINIFSDEELIPYVRKTKFNILR